METRGDVGYVYGVYDSAGALRYIGSTSRTPESRLRDHFGSRNKTQVRDLPFYVWLRSIDPSDVSIRTLMVVERDQRFHYEKAAIKAYDAAGFDLLNTMSTASWSATRTEMNSRPEFRAKMSKAKRGTRLSEETRRRMSESRRGSTRSESARESMRRATDDPAVHANRVRSGQKSAHVRRHSSDFVNTECPFCVDERSAEELAFAKACTEWLRAEKAWKKTPEARSYIRSRGGHVRYHTKLGVSNDSCRFCREDSEE